MLAIISHVLNILFVSRAMVVAGATVARMAVIIAMLTRVVACACGHVRNRDFGINTI